MANLDTRSKRASSVQILSPSVLALVLPDSAIDQADRQHVVWVYSGILASLKIEVDLTLYDRSVAFTISARSTSFTLWARSITLTLVVHPDTLTMEPHIVTLTLRSR